jgi:hypothetical protein
MFSVSKLRVEESKLIGKFINSFNSYVQFSPNSFTPFSKLSKDSKQELFLNIRIALRCKRRFTYQKQNFSLKKFG